MIDITTMKKASKNKYVDFVSDEHFMSCIKYVCESYPTGDVKKEITRNALDVFKMIFDITNHQIDVDEWMKSEEIRQTDKTVTNRIGEFHQKLLGGVTGWEDLGRGNNLGIDLKKSDNSIFIELKNKHNTVKGEDLKHVFDKLKKVADKHTKSIVYYAYIIPKKASSGECMWETSQRKPHKRIMEAWGSRVYEIVTGDKDSLRKTWNALPIAINDYFNGKAEIPEEDMKKLVALFESALQ